MKDIWVEGRVIENRRWNHRLFSLRLEAPVEPFEAGQFTRLALDIEGDRIARPYSFVNAPYDERLEFYFNTVPEGPLSNRLSRLRKGDGIWVAPRSVGLFTLSEVPDAEHLWLFATGTAIGPFLSILKTDDPWRRFSRIVLVHGVQTEDELTYVETIDRFRGRGSSKFSFVPFVSREDVAFAMKGRIPAAVRNGELEDRVGLTLNPEQSQVMICGNMPMIRDTQEALGMRGLVKNRRQSPGQITTEKYW